MDDLLSDLKCPITLQVFNQPVIASDGHVYEREALDEYLKTLPRFSPITREPITDKYYRAYNIKSIIDKIIENKSSIKKSQYNISILSSFYNKSDTEVIKILSEYESQYVDYNKIKSTYYKNNDIIKLIIDKTIDLECQTSANWRPIHYICRYSTPEMIKYIIDKGVDLECHTSTNWRPIHYICRYSTPEMIKYIIDKGVDLECHTTTNWKPIHFICKNSTPEMIKYIIDKGVDLDCHTNMKWKPIHFICRYSTPEMIKYIINKGVDLECHTYKKSRPIDLIYKFHHYDYKVIQYINERIKI
jgi:ankyrin repeat protein